MLDKYITHELVMVSQDANLEDVANLMREKNVGSVIVVEDKDTNPVPTGIITDRDMVTRLIAKDVNLDEVSVKDVASSPLVVIKDSQGLQQSLEAMENKGVRRAPVVDREGKLVGIISIDDILVGMIDKLESLASIIKRQFV